MEIREIRQDEELYLKARDLRYELFFSEHGLPKRILDDEKEFHSTHIAILQNNIIVGCGRLTRLTASIFQISQMVITPRYQSKGYGSMLIKDLIERAISSGAREIVLSARTTATQFYFKQGFVKVGEVYLSESTGVPHLRMIYRIT